MAIVTGKAQPSSRNLCSPRAPWSRRGSWHVRKSTAIAFCEFVEGLKDHLATVIVCYRVGSIPWVKVYIISVLTIYIYKPFAPDQ